MSDTNTISVGNYPSSNRVPGVFAAINASGANTATRTLRSLLLFQKIAGSASPPNQAVLIGSPADAITAFGNGSLLACAVERYFDIDPNAEVWAVGLLAAAGAAAAEATVVFVGNATANATIPLYVDGQRIQVPVTLGDTETIVAGSAAVAVNAYHSAAGNKLPESAASAAGTLSLTARCVGTIGNSFDVRLSYGGTAAGEGTPGTTNAPGITAIITQPAGGTLEPTLVAALANLPEKNFDFILCPYADTTTLDEMTAFLSDATGTWSYTQQLFGGCFTAFGGSLAQRTAFSTSLNDQHTSLTGANDSPSPDWQWAVDYMAGCAASLRANPALPIGGLTSGVALNVKPPPASFVDTFGERQVLLTSGMSTYKVDDAGVVHVDRAITTYQSNAAGGPDNSYLNLNVPYQLQAYIRAVETLIGTNFNQSILVADGSRVPPGSRMVTSQTILFSVVAQYELMATVGIPGLPVGLVQNPQAFASGARAENAGGGLVKMLLPVQLGNQLIAVAISVAFTQP